MNTDLELVLDAELVQHQGDQHGARVHVQHLADAVLGQVVQVFVGPAQRVPVGLTDAAEVAGDRLGAAEHDIAAVDAARVERLDVRRADDLHGRRDGDDVLPRGRLLGHVAHADVAPGHQLPAFDGPSRFGDEPGKELQGADLEGHGACLVDVGAVRRRAEHPASVVGKRHEGASLALLVQPLETLEVRRVLVAQALQPGLKATCLCGSAVDLVDSAVAGDQIEEALDQKVVGTGERGVDGSDAGGSERQTFAQPGPGDIVSIAGGGTALSPIGSATVDGHLTPPFVTRAGARVSRRTAAAAGRRTRRPRAQPP